MLSVVTITTVHSKTVDPKPRILSIEFPGQDIDYLMTDVIQQVDTIIQIRLTQGDVPRSTPLGWADVPTINGVRFFSDTLDDPGVE